MARYWIGNGGDISDTAHWSNTDGGAGGFSVPSSSTDVYFTANSFTLPGQTVTGTTLSFLTLSTVGISNNPTFTINMFYSWGAGPCTINLSGTFTFTLPTLQTYRGCTINSGGKTISYIYSEGSYDFNLASNLTVTATFNIYNSNLYTNNYTLNVGTLESYNDSTSATINLGSSTINLYKGGWNTRNHTINPGTSNIYLYGNNDGVDAIQYFYGEGKNFYKVWIYGKFTEFNVNGSSTYNTIYVQTNGTTYSPQVKINNTINTQYMYVTGTTQYIVKILNYTTNTNFVINSQNNPAWSRCTMTRCTWNNLSYGDDLAIDEGLDGGNNIHVYYRDPFAAGGLGTLASPYLISNAYQLNYIRYHSLAFYYKQTANIDVYASYPSWNKINSYPNGSGSPFVGYYNGDNYELQGLTNCLFDSLYFNRNNIAINIKLVNVNINGGALGVIGGLARSATAYSGTFSPIDNISITGTIIAATADKIGGLIGDIIIYAGTNITIKRISNNATITGLNYCGGIIGCLGYTNYGGTTTFNLEDCENRAAIDSIGYCAGGMIGLVLNITTTNIRRCINSGNLKGVNNVGGILGYRANTTRLYDCYALHTVSERVSGTTIDFNQLVGTTGATYTRCYRLSTLVFRSVGNPDTTTFPLYNDGTSITDANAKKQASYPNHTFSATYWGINEDTSYPYLKIQPITPPVTGFNIYVGDKQVMKIYKGSIEITKIYKGNVVI